MKDYNKKPRKAVKCKCLGSAGGAGGVGGVPKNAAKPRLKFKGVLLPPSLAHWCYEFFWLIGFEGSSETCLFTSLEEHWNNLYYGGVFLNGHLRLQTEAPRIEKTAAGRRRTIHPSIHLSLSESGHGGSSLSREAHLLLTITITYSSQNNSFMRINHEFIDHLGCRSVSGEVMIRNGGKDYSLTQITQSVRLSTFLLAGYE